MTDYRRIGVQLTEKHVQVLDTLPGTRAAHVDAALAEYLHRRMLVGEFCDRLSQSGGDTTMSEVSDPMSQQAPPEPRAHVVKRYPPESRADTTMSRAKEADDDISAQIDEVFGDWP